MELETRGRISRIPALDEFDVETLANKASAVRAGAGAARAAVAATTKNLTRFATGIANYSLNFLDVGLFVESTDTRAATAKAKESPSAAEEAEYSTPLSDSLSASLFSSALSKAKFKTTATTATHRNLTSAITNAIVQHSTPQPTTQATTTTMTPISLLMASSSKSPSKFQNATETVYATLANGIADAITPTIFSFNSHHQMPTNSTTITFNNIAATAAAAAATTTSSTTSTTITRTITSYISSTIATAAAGTTTSASIVGIGGIGSSNEIRLLDHAPGLSHSAMVKVYVLSVMAFLSLLGNIMTMWNIYKTRISRRNSRHSWSAIYSLIFHLSIADVLVTGFCIIGEAAWSYTVQWLADEITCKMVKLCQMFSLYLSTYVLVLIGVDRWIAVKYPMKSLNMAKRCYRLLGGTYVLSLLLSLPQFFIFHVARGPFVEEFHQCVTHGFYTAKWQEQLYTTFTLVFTFLLPLCILFGTYLSSFRTIASSEKMFQGSKLTTYSSKPSTQTNRQRLIHKAKMKSLRISVVIIFAFLICWTPYYVMMIIFMFWNPDKRFGEDLQSAIFFFGMSNSLVNPLIYGAFHLCPMKRKKSKYNNNNPHSLNRGDSQRTPSMLTAVTQVDSHGRQVRTYRPSYYRTQSNGSNSNYKEHVSLLEVTPTPSIIRTNIANSFRSNGKATLIGGIGGGSAGGGGGIGGLGGGSPHATAVLLSYDGSSSTNSAINRCNSDSYCVQETLLGKHHYTSLGSSDIGGCTSTKDRHALMIATNENISIV